MSPLESLGEGSCIPTWPRPTPKIASNEQKSIQPPPVPTKDSKIEIKSQTPVITKEHLVVDSGGFIRLKQLHAFGFQSINVTAGVLSEIRDRAARQNIALSIDTPKVLEPTEKDLNFVRKFARQTGDFGFLSAVDIEVIALTYMLQRMTGDVKGLRSCPPSEVKMMRDSDGHSVFTWGVGSDRKEQRTEEGQEGWIGENENQDENDDDDENQDENDDDDENQDENDDDDGEWICEDNLDEFCVNQYASLDAENRETTQSLRVACLTTDFSMQNVLLQMGLSVLSIDGMRVRSAKRWALLCRGCRKVMTDTTKQFCGHCGNAMLRRVAISVSSDGSVSVEEPKYKVSQRGKVYSIPKPKGGRKGDLILCEDQLYLGGRDRMLRQQQKVWDREKAMRDPFNPDNPYEQKGWHYRTREGPFKGAQIGLGPGNPNSTRWRLKNKRK